LDSSVKQPDLSGAAAVADNASDAIDVQSVSKIYRGETEVRALDGVSVTVRQNEFFTLLGPSGCGKTTLLRLIAGFEHPTSGAILLNGDDISLLPPNKRPVNTVFQNYALFPHMTVAGNIAFGLEMLGWSRGDVAETVDKMLKLVRMEELKHRKTSEISGGQQQRVALARALAPQPQVLLLDEPLSALDLKLRKEMQIELKRLQNETGITFVFVTHDQEEALTMSDRVAVMSAGKIHQVGSPREIYHHPQNRFVAGFIGDSNFLTATLGQANGGAVARLGSGIEMPVTLDADSPRSGEVSVLVRPEHARFAEPGAKNTINAVIENIVYFGTDTHFHLTLETGEGFTLRQQNSASEGEARTKGDTVAIAIYPDAVQVLRD
jgi:spermidine/putrescine transport system ATP-binding protein